MQTATTQSPDEYLSNPRFLPGDQLNNMSVAAQNELADMLRVDHAGEYGAVRIYEGQLRAVKEASHKDNKKDQELIATLTHMLEQEQGHLAYFNDKLPEQGVRPSVLMPLWHVMGGWLGYITARMGPETAMACTVAVETEIEEHYQHQLDRLQDPAFGDQSALCAKIEQFREEELEHHDQALEDGAAKAPFYPLVLGAIRTGARAAIVLARRF